MTPLRVLIAAAALAACVTQLSACTSKGHDAPTIDTTVTTHVTQTTQAKQSFTPTPASFAGSLAPGQSPPKGETEKACPYLPSSQKDGPLSMAALEGDRIYRTTVITTMNPLGCRFYFWTGPWEATADITTQTFASAQQAHDAIVLTAATGTDEQGKPAIVPGVDAVLYRTKFYRPDGATDWACVFAKGKIMVTIRTQRKDTSLNALLIAKAIAPKF